MAVFVDFRGLGGCVMYTDIPSRFCEVPELLVIGSGGGPVNSVTIAGTVTDQHGGVLTEMFEVILCG